MPARIKAVWIYDLLNEARSAFEVVKRETGVKRTNFILRHPFSHSPAVLTHLRPLLCIAPNDILETLVAGLLDPSSFLKTGAQLPTAVIHHLDHTEVCHADNMAAALYFSIDRGDRQTAEALLQCGADPRKLCDLRSAMNQRWAIRRLLEWRVEEMTNRCPYGWEGRVLAEGNDDERNTTPSSPSALPVEWEKEGVSHDELNDWIQMTDAEVKDTMHMLRHRISLLQRFLSSDPAGSEAEMPLNRRGFIREAETLAVGRRHASKHDLLSSNGTVAHETVDDEPGRIWVGPSDRKHAAGRGEKGVQKLIEKAWRAQQKQEEPETERTTRRELGGEGF